MRVAFHFFFRIQRSSRRVAQLGQNAERDPRLHVPSLDHTVFSESHRDLGLGG
jgi:hypothetical protein